MGFGKVVEVLNEMQIAICDVRYDSSQNHRPHYFAMLGPTPKSARRTKKPGPREGCQASVNSSASKRHGVELCRVVLGVHGLPWIPNAELEETDRN